MQIIHSASRDGRLINSRSPTDFTTMNAKELLECAPRLSESNRAYVLYNNGDRAIIVAPGASGKKITVRACNADGVQIGPVKQVSRSFAWSRS